MGWGWREGLVPASILRPDGGGQVAGDGNSTGEMYPDQSLYPVDSVPKMVERINNALLRTDQIHHMNGDHAIDWLAPKLPTTIRF